MVPRRQGYLDIAAPVFERLDPKPRLTALDAAAVLAIFLEVAGDGGVSDSAPFT